MYLKKLSLVNFKNIPCATPEFASGINCLVGDNGAGKTSILDSVYYLSMCKSAQGMTDRQCVRNGEEFFMLEGEYVSCSERHIGIVGSFSNKSGKSIKCAGKQYERLSDHVGLIPVVMVSPSDAFLVSDSAEERRRYLNGAISQIDRDYLENVMRYNAALSQRNRLLKQPPSQSQDEILSVLDQQIVQHGKRIFSRRAEYIESLRPMVEEYYRVLSDDMEQVELSYESDLYKGDFAELLSRAAQRDFMNQYTTVGVHRDDMLMRIGGRPLKKYGSQGQQKSFLVALKLAQYAVVALHKAEKPILLLDDLFDKLDAGRVQRLISLVKGDDFGQIFISDCNRERIEKILMGSGADYSLFEVRCGQVEKIGEDYEKDSDS